jgi:hypothetical protein
LAAATAARGWLHRCRSPAPATPTPVAESGRATRSECFWCSTSSCAVPPWLRFHQERATRRGEGGCTRGCLRMHTLAALIRSSSLNWSLNTFDATSCGRQDETRLHRCGHSYCPGETGCRSGRRACTDRAGILRGTSSVPTCGEVWCITHHSISYGQSIPHEAQAIASNSRKSRNAELRTNCTCLSTGSSASR